MRESGSDSVLTGAAPGLPKALWEAKRLHTFALRARWCENRRHQIVVPFTRDLEVGGSAEFKSLDQIVVHIGVDAGLLERVEGCSGGTTRNEPGFLIDVGRRIELAGRPDIIPMPPIRCGLVSRLACE